MIKFDSNPDFRKLGAYCICERQGGSLNIEIRAKKGDYSAFFSVHDKVEARNLVVMLHRQGVDMSVVEAAIREWE